MYLEKISSSSSAMPRRACRRFHARHRERSRCGRAQAREPVVPVPDADVPQDRTGQQRQQREQRETRLPEAHDHERGGERPAAWPVLPPTWNIDCARPWRPPDAMRATREASGWNTEDPMPISAAPSSTRILAGARQHHQAGKREQRAAGQRERRGSSVRIGADERLQQRGGDLVDQRDQADLPEVQAQVGLDVG